MSSQYPCPVKMLIDVWGERQGRFVRALDSAGSGWFAALDGSRDDKIFDATTRRPSLDQLAALWLRGHADVDEPGPDKPRLNAIDRRRAADATAQQRAVGLQFGRQGRAVDHIGNRETSTGLQHAKGLAEYLLLVGHQIDHAVR